MWVFGFDHFEGGCNIDGFTGYSEAGGYEADQELRMYLDAITQTFPYGLIQWLQGPGTRFYRYTMQALDGAISLAYCPRTAKNKDLHLTVRGEAFRLIGHERGRRLVASLLTTFRASRIDLAWDCVETFGDWLPEDLDGRTGVVPTGGLEPRRGKRWDQDYGLASGEKTGFTLGKSEFRTKVYDKLIKDPEWCNLTWPGCTAVMRIEFVIRGNTLKDQGIEDYYGLIEACHGIIKRRWHMNGSFQIESGYSKPRHRAKGSDKNRAKYWRERKQAAERRENFYAALERHESGVDKESPAVVEPFQDYFSSKGVSREIPE